MTNGLKMRQIFALYERNGWRLRRVLLTPETQNFLTGESFFEGAEIQAADLDAAWFSRASGAGREAWELRHLSENPYALLEVFDEGDDEEVRDETRFEIEQRLKGILNRNLKK